MRLRLRAELFLASFAVREESTHSEERSDLFEEGILGVLRDGLCNLGRWSDAAGLLSHFIKREISPNVITSTALVDAFVKNGKVLEAKELYEEMIRMSIDPDIVIYSSLINGLCMQDRVDEASEMFGLMVRRGCSPDVVSYNTLINGLCKAKRVEDGMRLVREMSERGLMNSPDIWTYNILLGGLCDNGEVEKALVMFEDLQKSEMEVDIVTYTTIIHGMCKAGKVEDAWGLFCSLSVKVVKPDVVAYSTMLSGLCNGLVLNDGKLCLRDGDITVSADVIKELLTRATSEGRFLLSMALISIASSNLFLILTLELGYAVQVLRNRASDSRPMRLRLRAELFLASFAVREESTHSEERSNLFEEGILGVLRDVCKTDVFGSPT
ncbi:hypothetical protein Bca4012_042373 [Brassica carinata]